MLLELETASNPKVVLEIFELMKLVKKGKLRFLGKEIRKYKDKVIKITFHPLIIIDEETYKEFEIEYGRSKFEVCEKHKDRKWYAVKDVVYWDDKIYIFKDELHLGIKDFIEWISKRLKKR